MIPKEVLDEQRFIDELCEDELHERDARMNKTGS